jgi:hypothetical protein
MKRFKCTVTREDEYIIEFDENLINKEWMEEFNKYFTDDNTFEEHAENIAQYRARFCAEFIEGYGEVNIKYKSGYEIKKNSGVTIIINSEDEYCEVDVEEIEGVE